MVGMLVTPRSLLFSDVAASETKKEVKTDKLNEYTYSRIACGQPFMPHTKNRIYILPRRIFHVNKNQEP